MLPPLDTRKLRALLRDEDDDEELECDPRGHISIIKELITEDRNWSDGVLRLLGLWPRIDPRFYRKKPMSTCHPLYDKGGPNNWWIDFHVHPQFHRAVSSTADHPSRTRFSVAFASDRVAAVSLTSLLSENAFSRFKLSDVVEIGQQ